MKIVTKIDDNMKYNHETLKTSNSISQTFQNQSGNLTAQEVGQDIRISKNQVPYNGLNSKYYDKKHKKKNQGISANTRNSALKNVPAKDPIMLQNMQNKVIVKQGE